MKIKCVKCEQISELTQDEIEHLVNTSRRYTEDISPNDYTSILSVIKGKCTDNKKHLFIYEESFSKQVTDLIYEHDKLIKTHNTNETNIANAIQKIEGYKLEISNLETKKQETIKENENIDIKTVDIIKEFSTIAGSSNMEMWK